MNNETKIEHARHIAESQGFSFDVVNLSDSDGPTFQLMSTYHPAILIKVKTGRLMVGPSVNIPRSAKVSLNFSRFWATVGVIQKLFESGEVMDRWELSFTGERVIKA